MRITVTKIFTFDAAHGLPGHEGKCQNMHGHTYKLEVTICRVDYGNPLIEMGSSESMVMDFADLKEVVQSYVIDRWDHKCINDVEEWRPTAENMAKYAFWAISNALPPDVAVTKVRLWETPTSYAEVTP